MIYVFLMIDNSDTEEDAEERLMDFDLEMCRAIVGFKLSIYRIGGEVSSFYIFLLFLDFRHPWA